MELQDVITSLVLPALISVGVAVINNKRQKKIEYEYEYMNYILSKRKVAYDAVERLLSETNLIALPGNILMHRFFYCDGHSDTNPLARFNDMLVNTIDEHTWLSPNLYKKLIQMNALCISLLNDHRAHSADSLHRMGQDFYPTMVANINQIVHAYFSDLKNMADVATFLSEKEKDILTKPMEPSDVNLGHL